MSHHFRSVSFVVPFLATAWLLNIASTANAVLFTDSNQLNLAGRDVLSAVNFYDSTPVSGGGQQVTGTIQGVSFLNLDHQTQTVAGALTVSFPHAGDGRSQTGASITGTGADQAKAVQLASSMTYFASGEIGSLSYAFGPTYANRAVQVQLIGGDSGWTGVLDVKIGGISQGTMTGDTNSATAELLTFNAVTNGSGNLVLDLVESVQFYGLSGAIVTTAVIVPPVPEPSSMTLLGLGAFVLVRRLRKATGE